MCALPYVTFALARAMSKARQVALSLLFGLSLPNFLISDLIYTFIASALSLSLTLAQADLPVYRHGVEQSAQPAR